MDTENTTNSCPICWRSFVEHHLHYDGFLPFNSGVECACAENNRSKGCLQKVPQPILLTSDVASASFNLLVHFYERRSGLYSHHGLGEAIYLEIVYRAKKAYEPKHSPEFYLDWVAEYLPSFERGGMFACISQRVYAWTVEEQIDIASESSLERRYDSALGVLRT